MKVAIYGSSEGSSQTAIHSAREIGKFLAEKKHTVITGACRGLPFEAALAAFSNGGQVVGYSPAINEEEHVTKYSDPTECFTELIFIPSDYEYATNEKACYKYRNIRSAINCDKAIIIGGRYGTFDEFILAYEFGKEIGVMENTGGVSEIIATDIMKSTLEKIYKNTGAKVHFKEDPVKLLEAMKLL